MKLKDKFDIDSLSHKKLIDGGMTFHSISGYKPNSYFDQPFLRLGTLTDLTPVTIDIFDSMVTYPGKPKIIIESPAFRDQAHLLKTIRYNVEAK